ncbi:MAG: hypothetical protein M3548_10020 [Actinomycetota bacterium]|nr:hypothetical protein [Actinomycetota bacterium]
MSQQPYPASYPPPPVVPPKRRKKWPWVLVGILILCVGAFAACVSTVNSVVEEGSRPVTVAYEVGGDAVNATVMYTTFGESGMSTSTETLSSLPWSKSVEAAGFGKGGSLTVSTGAEGGTVTCKVTIDGKATKTGTASGQFAIASCSGF